MKTVYLILYTNGNGKESMVKKVFGTRERAEQFKEIFSKLYTNVTVIESEIV